MKPWVVVVAGLVVLAVLSVTGKNVGMLVSVIAIALILWRTWRRPLRVKLTAIAIASLTATLTSEAVHLLYHRVRADIPDHQGFWMSAVLVGIINVAAVAACLLVAQAVKRNRNVEIDGG